MRSAIRSPSPRSGHPAGAGNGQHHRGRAFRRRRRTAADRGVRADAALQLPRRRGARSRALCRAPLSRSECHGEHLDQAIPRQGEGAEGADTFATLARMCQGIRKSDLRHALRARYSAALSHAREWGGTCGLCVVDDGRRAGARPRGAFITGYLCDPRSTRPRAGAARPIRMPGWRSTCPARVGWSSTRPTASSDRTG